MTIITRQNVLAEKVRFFISVGGIALSVFLISFLLSLFQGWKLNVGRFVERVDADVWIARDGTTDFLNAASILPNEMGEELLRRPDVEDVDALVVRPMEVSLGGGREEIHLVGYEVAQGAGGPPGLKDGEAPPNAEQIVVDSAFTQKAGGSVGDVVEVSGAPLEISGISTGGNLIFSQTAFIDIETARTILSMNGLSTFYLLHVAEGADPSTVADDIAATTPDVSAFTNQEFADATRDRIMSNVIPILFVILLLAFVVGVAITGLTIYTAAVEKSREFGILKAIGFPNSYLFRLVLEQSLLIGLLGFIVGVGLTVVASQFVGNLVPQFVTQLRWQDIVLVLGTTLLMSVLAAFLPVRKVATVDPVTVFSG